MTVIDIQGTSSSTVMREKERARKSAGSSLILSWHLGMQERLSNELLWCVHVAAARITYSALETWPLFTTSGNVRVNCSGDVTGRLLRSIISDIIALVFIVFLPRLFAPTNSQQLASQTRKYHVARAYWPTIFVGLYDLLLSIHSHEQ